MSLANYSIDVIELLITTYHRQAQTEIPQRLDGAVELQREYNNAYFVDTFTCSSCTRCHGA